jgi:hypothetical protein
MPNVTPLEFAKMSVPVETDCVPALTPKGVSGATEAVICELPLIPKVTPWLFENTSVPVETDCVPALIPNGVSGRVENDAVI